MARDWTNTFAQYLEMDGTGLLNITSDFTLHAWVHMDARDGRIISKWHATAGNRQYLMQADAGGTSTRIGGSLRSSGGTAESASGGNDVPLGSWCAMGVRKLGSGAGALSVWRNGSNDGSNTSNNVPGSTSTAVRIGDEPGGGDIADGRICECAIWAVGLSNAEMGALWKGVPAILIRRASLVGYWPVFGIGSPEPDFSGNKYNGTVGSGNPAYSGTHAPVSRHILAAGAG